MLAQRVKAVLATTSWHLAPAKLRLRMRRESVVELSVRDFTAGISGGIERQGLHCFSPTIHPGGGLDSELQGCLHVLGLSRGQNDVSLI